MKVYAISFWKIIMEVFFDIARTGVSHIYRLAIAFRGVSVHGQQYVNQKRNYIKFG